jgi:CheY-like chemotaxis protein
MKKILLVDDHPEDNHDFISVLRDSGYKVDVTAYISTARIKLKQPDRYDLVVMDIMMPT